MGGQYKIPLFNRKADVTDKLSVSDQQQQFLGSMECLKRFVEIVYITDV